MTQYPREYDRLVKRMGDLKLGIPGTLRAFGSLHRESLAEGALSAKTKELLALAIAITVRCDGCIAFHVHDALKAGAERGEILETIGVAILMGGGPAMVYGCQALDAMEQFQEQSAGSQLG